MTFPGSLVHILSMREETREDKRMSELGIIGKIRNGTFICGSHIQVSTFYIYK